MSTHPAAASNLYFVVFPDFQAARRLERLITEWDSNAVVHVVPGLAELYNQLPSVPDKAIVLIDLIWDGQDASDILLSLLYSYPQLAFLIVSDSDVASILPPYFPIPHIQGFNDTNRILSDVSSLTEDLRGTRIGPYQIQNFAGQNYLGRTYQAYQAAINRDVHLTVLPLFANDDTRTEFSNISAAWARNIFPQIYSIYEENAVDGRHYVAQEPVTNPSLLQLSLQEVHFDSRLIASILATTVKVLAHLQSKGIPYQPIRSSHITISQQGVIKLVNTALPSTSPMPDMLEELHELAKILHPFQPPDNALDPRLNQILQNMAGGLTDFNTVIDVAEKVNLELAPVKQVVERKTAVAAKQEVEKAKKSMWLVTYLSVASITILIISLLIMCIPMLFPDKFQTPGRDFSDQIKIPAGPVTYGPTSNQQTAQLPEFYIDKYEVTIGQYEKFLKALDAEIKKDPEAYKKYLPPEAVAKYNFVPYDWINIKKTLRKGIPQPTYGTNRVTRDTAVFNVDYFDAYAYAKWAGKRLPTELEWQRAAGGNDNFPYPWGKDYKKDYIPDNAVCNAYPDLVKAKRFLYPGPQIVDKYTADKSPFGVIGMAGNVSEWVSLSPELGPLTAKQENCMPIKGANFSSPQLIPNTYNRQPGMVIPEDSMNNGLGFRCASDKPVTKK
ncbi:MAG: SUMF1/EgtB/PvdO family nonheme iron enzyme [Verrucomicrobiales bacterium]|jgi:formylglycine-generating enzyme required for sulfatase activity|nr:SUMF1/EgtB/PvdO family nonheme iron enzyme [Verrucomicrobiales bacterium]